VKFWKPLFVGFGVSSLALCAFAGGVDEGLQLLLISVVCTLGAGLLVWIPLWWVVGWVTLLVIGLFKDKTISPGLKSPMTRDADVVGNYIRDARAQGKSDADIDQELRLHGWREEFIRETRQRLD
jgi:hypothetical protein